MKLKKSKKILMLLLISIPIIILLKLFTVSIHTPSNIVEVGIKNNSGKIISTGKTINPEVIIDGLEFEISQDLHESREYLILFFIDYQQVIVNSMHEKNSEIYLELDPYDSAIIPFSIDVPQNANELSILIIKKPNYMVATNDIDRAIKAEDIISLRYSIKNEAIKEYKYSNIEHSIVEGDIKTRVFLSKNINDFKICTTLESEEKVYISLGNKSDENTDYAIIALKNWSQVPINNEYVQYFSIDVDKQINFEHKLPKTFEDINYQLVVFPNPYGVTDQDYSTTFAYATHRIHVLGKK